MGTKKLKNPFQIGRPKLDPVHSALLRNASLALAEYNGQKEARRLLGGDKEARRCADEMDDAREIWMWGLFAVILHRKYRFTAKKISEILGEVQALHNELYEASMDEEDLKRNIYNTVKAEVGLSIFDDDMGGHNA